MAITLPASNAAAQLGLGGWAELSAQDDVRVGPGGADGGAGLPGQFDERRNCMPACRAADRDTAWKKGSWPARSKSQSRLTRPW